MKTIDVDARRYAWCRGQALWKMGLPVAALLEDLRGAVDAGQDGLARHSARNIAMTCGVVLALVLYYERPIPKPRMRASWARQRIAGTELGDECIALVQGSEGALAGELAERCESLVAGVRELVGDIPDPLTPEGYFPALALARDWLKLAEAVGEEGFLPLEWITGGNN